MEQLSTAASTRGFLGPNGPRTSHSDSTQLDSLPRAALLRLQRWAIDEMIADPALDLTALTRMNANDDGVCVCIKRIDV